MSATENVCRLCLKTTSGFSSLDATCAEKLQQIVPNLKLTLSANPVICNECKEKLEDSHKLKRTCSSSNKLIHFLKNYLEIKQDVELKELLKGSRKTDKLSESAYVCRICLKGNEGEGTSLADAKASEYGTILVTCLSDVEENLTLDPKLCKLCIDSFHNMRNFIKQLTDVENRVKSYSEKAPSENVDLLKVLDFVEDKEEAVQAECDVKTTPEVSDKKEENKKRPGEDVDEVPPKKQKINEEEEKEEEELPDYEEEDDDSQHTDMPHFKFTSSLFWAPYSRKHRIEDWMKKVESYKAKMKLSDATIKQKIVGMMWRLPQLQSWFSSVADVTSWEEFKDKVLHAFPANDDHYCLTVKMVQRKKKPTENYTEYYEAKLALLEPLNFTEEQVICALWGGLSNHLVSCMGRMGRCKTREEALAFFKSCDDKSKVNYYWLQTNEPSEPPKTKKKINQLVKSNCPEKLVALDNGISDRVETNLLCRFCDQKGHCSLNCSLINSGKIESLAPTNRKGKTATNRERSTGNIIVLQDNSDETKTEQETNETIIEIDEVQFEGSKSESASISESLKDTKSSGGLRCACCDKSGHSSMNCPLIRNATPPQQLQKAEQPVAMSESMKKTMQETNETVVEIDEVQSEVSKSASVSESSKEAKPSGGPRCVCCDKSGHSSMNCPLIRNTTPPQQPQKAEQPVAMSEIMKKTMQETNETVVEIDVQSEVSKSASVSESSKEAKPSGGPRCVCCDKSGHSSMNCPLIRNATPPQQPQKPEKPVALSESVKKANIAKIQSMKNGTSHIVKKCSYCESMAHASSVCPLIYCKEPAPRRSKIKILLDKDRSDKKEQADNVTHLHNNLEEQPNSKTDTGKKCSYCDSLGHSSTVCPLITCKEPTPRLGKDKDRSDKGKSNVKQSRNDSMRKPTIHKVDTEKKCSYCNSTGHSSAVCPRLRKRKDGLEKKEQASNVIHSYNDSLMHKPLETQPIHKIDTEKKCSYCNGAGHSSAVCPLINCKESIPRHGKDKNEQASNVIQLHNDDFVRKLLEKQLIPEITDAEKCSYCNSAGHSSAVCPLVYSKEPTPHLGNSSYNQKQQANYVMHSYNNDLVHKLPEQQIYKLADMRKCPCCSETGHAIAHCPLLRQAGTRNETPKKTTRWEQEPRQERNAPQISFGLQKCSSCDNIGHSNENCPFFTGCDMSDPIESVIQTDPVLLKKASNRKCLCCNQIGHSSLDCPLLNMHLTGQSVNQVEKYEPKCMPVVPEQKCFPVVPEQKCLPVVLEETCSYCDRMGHASSNCPFYTFFQRSDQPAKHSVPNWGNSSKQFQDNAQPSHTTPSDEQKKCYFCDKVGHFSIDCFHATFRQEQAKFQAAQSSSSQQTDESPYKDHDKVVRCDFCNKVGHKTSDCFFAKFDKKSTKKPSKMCVICGKFGHTPNRCRMNTSSSKKIPAKQPGHSRR